MCIIVDANKLHDFADPTNEDAEPIRAWLKGGKGSLVYSDIGQYGKETDQVQAAKELFRRYSREGKAKLIPHERFVNDEKELSSHVGLRSDDPHVLALARASGARLLFTGDSKLMADFKNKTFIDNPRGSIYSSATNKNLLTTSVCPSP